MLVTFMYKLQLLLSVFIITTDTEKWKTVMTNHDAPGARQRASGLTLFPGDTVLCV